MDTTSAGIIKLKKLLIISPHFVPVNAADMHRIRQSLMYYQQEGWLPEIVTVENSYISIPQDSLLEQTIPKDIKIHKVKAWTETLSRKFGLGNIALRSMLAYRKYVNQLLKKEKFDLIFFSTTAFQICILGRYWKSKFNIPYIIDMQDPWRSDHYLEIPKKQRPPKFLFSYMLDTILERYTMKKADGVMAVSDKYIAVLKNRYPHLKNIPSATIPFAAYPIDIELIQKLKIDNPAFKKNNGLFHISYVGRGGYDMSKSGNLILKAFKHGLQKYDAFKKVHLYFIGTSYDITENAQKTILPIAETLGLTDYVTEQTTRVTYFEALKILNDSDVLMIPGSDNIGYTASKIYQYVWLKKPMFTVFHSSSSINDFMEQTKAGLNLQFDEQDESFIIEAITEYINEAIKGNVQVAINWEAFEKFSSAYQTKRQVELFNRVLSNGNY